VVVKTLQTDVLRFSVIAESDGTDRQAARMLSGVANVTVRVLDINDNSPVIDDPAPNTVNRTDDVLHVCGHARAGDHLRRIVASDLDSGLNARLRYSLIADDAMLYFSVNSDDGRIVARQDLSQLAVSQTFLVTVIVTDSGQPPLSANKTLLLTISHDQCITAAEASAGQRFGVAGRLTVVVFSTVVIIIVVAVLSVLVLLVLTRGRCRRRRRDKTELGGGGVVTERRWTEADGAEELTAKQRLNTAEKTSTAYYQHPADETDICSIQHEFEVVWQTSPSCCLRQVFFHFCPSDFLFLPREARSCVRSTVLLSYVVCPSVLNVGGGLDCDYIH